MIRTPFHCCSTKFFLENGGSAGSDWCVPYIKMNKCAIGTQYHWRCWLAFPFGGHGGGLNIGRVQQLLYKTEADRKPMSKLSRKDEGTRSGMSSWLTLVFPVRSRLVSVCTSKSKHNTTSANVWCTFTRGLSRCKRGIHASGYVQLRINCRWNTRLKPFKSNLRTMSSSPPIRAILTTIDLASEEWPQITATHLSIYQKGKKPRLQSWHEN